MSQTKANNELIWAHNLKKELERHPTFVKFVLTEPELSTEISKSSGIISPVAIKIFAAVFATLKHLQRNTPQKRLLMNTGRIRPRNKNNTELRQISNSEKADRFNSEKMCQDYSFIELNGRYFEIHLRSMSLII